VSGPVRVTSRPNAPSLVLKNTGEAGTVSVTVTPAGP